ncbi:hypothetical protein AB0F72_17685 [Actinoplanes sp. NPDC023936]|uniref:hypothetical protein n=1 Tax=Actinoplanes sp. NPDC023936 TaxID=3154910 RepID=UPI0033C1E08D
MSRSWPTLWTAATLAAVTGCAAGHQAGPAPVPASPSAAPAYYTGLSGECPTLTSPEAVRFTSSHKAEGIRSPKQRDYERIDCAWSSADVTPPWVVVALMIYHGPDTARQAAEQYFNQGLEYDTSRANFSSAIRATKRTTPSGPAYVVANAEKSSTNKSGADQVSQTTLVGNVIVNVLLFEKQHPGVDRSTRAVELLADLAATGDAITAEIAGQLVSQT